MSFERNNNVKDALKIGHSRTAIPVGMIWLIKKKKSTDLLKDGKSSRTEEVSDKYIPEILDRISKGHQDIWKFNKAFKKYVGFIILSEKGKIIDLVENPGIVLSYKEKFYKMS